MNDIQNYTNNIINSIKHNLLKPMTDEIKDCVKSEAAHQTDNKIKKLIIIILFLCALNTVSVLGLILFLIGA